MVWCGVIVGLNAGLCERRIEGSAGKQARPKRKGLAYPRSRQAGRGGAGEEERRQQCGSRC